MGTADRLAERTARNGRLGPQIPAPAQKHADRLRDAGLMRIAEQRIAQLKVKIFADSADYDTVVRMANNTLIKGFTTNPSLMRKAGVNVDYEAFARHILAAVPDRPVSFEVFADDFDAMARQARVIASWGPNVNVKIPVTNSRGDFAGVPINLLSSE